MTEPIEIRSGGSLLFVLTPQGHVEYFRGGWLHTVDINETLRTGRPVVTRSYVGPCLTSARGVAKTGSLVPTMGDQPPVG